MSTLTQLSDALKAADPSAPALRASSLKTVAESSLLDCLIALYGKTGDVANAAHALRERGDPAAITVAAAGLLATREMLGIIIEHIETQAKAKTAGVVYE